MIRRRILSYTAVAAVVAVVVGVAVIHVIVNEIEEALGWYDDQSPTTRI